MLLKKREREKQSKVDTTFVGKWGMRYLFCGFMQNRVTQASEVHNKADYTHMLIITR